jgi:hypothetical protein
MNEASIRDITGYTAQRMLKARYDTLSTVAEIPLRRINAAVKNTHTQSKSHGRTHLTLATILEEYSRQVRYSCKAIYRMDIEPYVRCVPNETQRENHIPCENVPADT